MLTVFKYGIPMTDNFTLMLPQGAKILSVQEQHDMPQMWCLVDDNAPLSEARLFRLAGTGHPIYMPKEKLHYVGTWQSLGGRLVWHLFEVEHDHS